MKNIASVKNSNILYFRQPLCVCVFYVYSMFCLVYNSCVFQLREKKMHSFHQPTSLIRSPVYGKHMHHLVF